MTLGDAYSGPIRPLPVNAVDTEAVLKVLQLIWTTVPETASRLRGRIENVLHSKCTKCLRVTHAINKSTVPPKLPVFWFNWVESLARERLKVARSA